MIKNKAVFIETLSQFLDDEYTEKYGQFKGVEIEEGDEFNFYYITVEKDGVRSKIPCIDCEGAVRLDSIKVTSDEFGNIVIKGQQ